MKRTNHILAVSVVLTSFLACGIPLEQSNTSTLVLNSENSDLTSLSTLPLPGMGASVKTIKPPDIPGHSDFTNSLGMKFVKIAAGKFIMGNGIGMHEVTLSKSFYMQTTEVTQEQYQSLMGPQRFRFEGEINLPADRISWVDAQNFIDQLNTRGEGVYRLPTEAEWEYAARAGSKTDFACGDSSYPTSCVRHMGWTKNNSNGKTHPVAQKQPNIWGLYDMHGNLFEWVEDWYQDYDRNESVIDPKGPVIGTWRVERGGSYDWGNDKSRVWEKSYANPNSSENNQGFRIVREL